MSKTLKSLAIAGAFACLAASPSARAQTAPGAPRIFDADGRLVGAALGAEPIARNGRVLVAFDKGAAVLNIESMGLYTQGALGDFGIYYATPDCSGPAYMRVRQFPNYGLFAGDGQQKTGYSQAGTVIYPSMPFKTVTLVAETVGGVCKSDLFPPTSAVVGVATVASLPRYKLPFYTK